jgi:hypothetical protein
MSILEHSNVIVRSVTIFFCTQINNNVRRDHDVLTFTFTDTFSDAQNIVSELPSRPAACHSAPANQFHSDVS